MTESQKKPDLEGLAEAQLLLAEKRTELAVLRTGIAILVLPASVISLLIATSSLYDIVHVFHLMIIIYTICSALAILGIYFITVSFIKMRLLDKHISSIKHRSELLDSLIT